MGKLISVIISNRNDLAVLGITLCSVLEGLVPFGAEGELVICDNSDEQFRPAVAGVVPAGYLRDGRIKLIEQPFACLFTARERAAKSAEGKYILCLDSHMLVGHNMITDMVEFMESHGPEIGFGHAPINWAHFHESRARHDRVVTEHELGPWGGIHATACRITWKGMPWICHRDWFLNDLKGYGALSEHRLSWGGGDMHIGYKPWLLGFENWAIPCRAGIHIGPFPSLAGGKAPGDDPFALNKYRVYKDSGHGPACLGFLVSCYVLGGEEMMQRNAPMITKRFGQYINVQRQWDKAKALGQGERDRILRDQVCSFDELMARPPWVTNTVQPKQQHPVP